MEPQKEILLSLVDGLEGSEWAETRRGWSSTAEESVCQWEGVSCDGESVVAVKLPKTDLFVPQLPSELGLLESLRVLDFERNSLRGTLPLELAELPNLEELNLNDNQLSGSIPKRWGSSFYELFLANNNFSGSLEPDWMLQNPPPNLVSIDIQGNSITGYLPFGLQSLTSLVSLSFNRNLMGGTLPEFLGRMSSLSFLYLDHNGFVGTIPTSWRNHTDEATSPFKEVWLEKNHLSGTIPSGLSEYSGLRNLYLDGNKLTGTVPDPLCRAGLNDDFVAEEGEDTESSVTIVAAGRMCETVLCPKGKMSIDGLFPCNTDCDDLNPYLGRHGEECPDRSEAQIVGEMFAGDGDHILDSPCDYKGVSCNEKGQVIGINATSVGLAGTISDELGFLPALRVLDLSDNLLTGPLPSGLRLASLEHLDISGNKLTGIVPAMLCLKQGDNGNSGGNCDAIACPVGTYSDTGRGDDCWICEASRFLASKTCPQGPSDAEAEFESDDGFGDNGERSSKDSSVIFILSIVFLALFALFILSERITKRRRPRRYAGRESKSDGDDDSSSFPHVEELKARIGWRRRRRDYGPTGWIQTRVRQAQSYVISLSETPDDLVIPDAPKVNVTEGIIDDYGWRERESILKHRDLERAVDKLEGTTQVWEYPDPLEQDALSMLDSFHNRSNDGVDRQFCVENDDGTESGSEDRSVAKSVHSSEDFLDVPMIE